MRSIHKKSSHSRTNPGHLQLLRDNTIFVSILENLNSGVALIDEQGRFISYNKKFLNLFGLSEHSTIKNVNDQNWADWQVLDKDLRVLDVDDHPVRKAAITGTRVSNQLCGVILPSGGDVIWMLISAEPVFENGRIIKTICTYLDVTEHTIADAALRRSESNLRELNATKDKLFSIISHDLKGPFSSIVGFSELLLEKLEKNDLNTGKEFAKIILDSSWQAMDLLTNLIEWSRLQTGRMTYHPAPISFINIVEDVTRQLSASALQKSINLQLNIHEDTRVMADKAMVRTIIRNLISNAIKFTRPGGKIILSTSVKNEKLRVEVCDTGVGMSKEFAEKLFSVEENTYSQGTHNEKGTGLGMFLCREFVAMHKGDIQVESTPGAGSRFYFTLPVAPGVEL